MDHPLIVQALKTGYPNPQPKLIQHKEGKTWDPIEWMKVKDNKK